MRSLDGVPPLTRIDHQHQRAGATSNVQRELRAIADGIERTARLAVDRGGRLPSMLGSAKLMAPVGDVPNCATSWEKCSRNTCMPVTTTSASDESSFPGVN